METQIKPKVEFALAPEYKWRDAKGNFHHIEEMENSMFKLPPEAEAEYQRLREYADSQKQLFAGMSDGNLAASAKFWMQHCQAPKQMKPEEPIYDSTFWHAIVPELIKRLER